MTTNFFDTKGRAAHITTLTDAVAKAKKSVLAVTLATTKERSDDALHEAREKYFRALLEGAAAGRFRYIRVLQSDSENAIVDGYDDLYVEHFRRMLDLKASLKDQDAVDLRTMPPFLPATFVLVDGIHFAWEICEFAASSQRPWQSRYSLHVRDEAGGGLEGLMQMVEKITSGSTARAVQPDELWVQA